MKTSTETSISRRNFLRGSIVVATGAVGAIALSGCTDPTTDTATIIEEEVPTAAPPRAVNLYRGYYAGHGERCFTQGVVAVDESGVIVALHIDDYQYLDKTIEGIIPVPNATRGFSAGNIDTMWLVSKRENDGYYSEHMAEAGEATQGWLESMSAIEAYAIGKTPEELADVELDAVSGSTLEDTLSYLAGIEAIVSDAIHVSAGSIDSEGGEVEIGVVSEACHGANAFANTASLVQGETLVCTLIDEFQYMDATTEGVAPVPNYDKTFGTANFVAGRVLASKAVNSEVYGANMKDRADATQDWLESIEPIQEAFAGKKVSELNVADFSLDAISGSTLSDTANYAKSAVDAAVQAWWS